jgi:Carboxypeptidase regulatory-like domain
MSKNVLGCFFVFAFTLLAEGGGSITGKVVDIGGDPVGNAVIQATNSRTKSVYKGTTSAAGTFTIGRLPAGNYEISSFTLGFVPFFRHNVAIASAQEVRLDLHFEDLQLNTLGDGRDQFVANGTPHKTPVGPAPRMPDGKPDLSGVWYPRRVVDPGKPQMKAWAEAVVKERAENNQKDFPQTHCWPLGLIANTLQFWKLVQTPKLLVIMIEGELPRQVFMDGRGHPADVNPTWVGHSVGRWENETLVVDTVGFNNRSWLDLEGRPHTENMHMTERYRRRDLGHLEIETIINDPDTFIQPWIFKSVADLAPKDEIQEYVCTENERDREHIVGK